MSAAGIRTLLPRLVPVAALDRANALDTSIWGMTDVVGPALAGLLVGIAGAAPAFAVIAMLYAGAAICVGGVRCAHVTSPRWGHLGAIWGAIWYARRWHGLLRVVRQPTLRGLAVCYALYQVTWGVLIVAVPVVAAREFLWRHQRRGRRRAVGRFRHCRRRGACSPANAAPWAASGR